MTMRRLCPVIAICYAALIAACIPRLATCQEHDARYRDIALGNSDGLADAVLTVQNAGPEAGFGARDQAKITSILATIKELVGAAGVLVQNEKTRRVGQDKMEKANAMYREVMQKMSRRKHSGDDRLKMLRGKYSEEDIQLAKEDEQRRLDLVRSLFETYVTFPECVEKLFEECLAIINSDLSSLGLSTIEVVVREKRNLSQEGYNKVVIVTNELADRVVGQAGDGIVTYPFLWDDKLQGPRMLGVDGKWNCQNLAPEDCCDSIKTSVPNPDAKDKHLECHIFVPFGGVGNPRRNDRVFIIVSPDGRVHEPPVIQ
jgi:hypothetical protein